MPNTTPHTPNAAPKLDGQQAVELLPWLANGSLDGVEIEALGSQLAATDADFAADLAATGEMLWITEQHIPTLALTEYALGLEPGELSGLEGGLKREEIELHLESCAACRAELELIRADEGDEATEEATVLDFTSARRRRVEKPAQQPVRPAWRRLALAAALATAIAGALLLQVQSDLESPAGLVAVAEVLPADHAADSEKSLRSSTPDAALFFDGFESGDTGNWITVSN